MKRLLVVANPFPPMVSAGTTRVLRFLRHLPDHGWEATVLTARATGPAALPVAVPVVRTATLAPRRLLSGGRGGRLADWVFVPDPHIVWAPTAIAAGRRLLAAERFDAILSSHPRASTHVVAASLSCLSGVPWVADYRDRRFANVVRTYPTPAHAAANRTLEAHVLRRAAALTAVNAPILDDLVAFHPWLAGRAHVLSNGYDDGDPVEPADLGPGFWFVYTGRIYKREAPLEAFLSALAALPEDVRALFVGDEPRVRPIAERLGIGHRVRTERYAPHARALGCQHAADALLLVTQRRPESLSSKVFEYLRSGRPVFAVSAPTTAAVRLFAEIGGAVIVDHDDDMREPMARFVASVRGGDAPRADMEKLARYDMARITGELAAILDTVAAMRGRA